ncbi:MAG: T9SS type A sorting domain-containing protein [Bacteroidia bacterium]|nr:T9SS type A sorting domain-containing protein [Bacteroidia bacterium]
MTLQIKRWISAIILSMLLLPVLAQELKKPSISTSGTVYAIARRDSITYLGGAFYEAGYYSSRLALTDSLDAFPDTDFPMANGAIEDIESDGNGGWYVGGSFSQIGGQGIRYLAHILADGSVDQTFNPNPNSTVYDLLRVDGDLYVGGSFTELAGQTVRYAGQLVLGTGQAGAWQPDPNSTVYALAYNPATSIYVGGSFTSIAGKSQRYFAEIRIAADTLIPTISVNSTVYDIVISGNDVYLGGSFSEAGHYTSRMAITRQDVDFPDNRFPEINGTLERIISDGAGGWYIGGSFSQVAGTNRRYLAHILSDYSLDANFNPDPNATVYTLEKYGNLLYVGGSFTQIGGQSQGYAACIDLTNGSLVSSWNPQVNSTVYAISREDSLIYLGGSFTTVGGERQRYLARVTATSGAVRPCMSTNSTVYAIEIASAATGGDGRTYLGGSFSEQGYYAPSLGMVTSSVADFPDPAYPAANSTVYAVIPDGAGGWYVGGSFSQIGNQSVSRLAHILPNKTVDPSFVPNPSSTVSALLLSNNVLYVGGSFTQIGGASAGRVAALDATTGQVLSGWITSPPTANSTVEALALDGTTLYIGGSFTDLNGQTRNRLAALDATTGALLALNPGLNSTVYGLALDGNALYIGGSFSQIAGQSRSYLAALDKTTGTLIAGFNPMVNSTVYSLEVRGGQLYAGGSFTMAGGQPRNYAAQLNLTSGSATTWNPNFNSTVYSLRNGYAGGSFTTAGGQSRRYAAKIEDNGTLASWHPDLSSTVYTIGNNGTDVLLGGSFTYFRYRTRNYLAVMEPQTGQIVDSWTATANSTVYTLKRQDNTYMYVGGSFTQLAGQPRNYAGEINISGAGTATAWNPNLNSTVYGLSFEADTVFLAGSFTTASGQNRKYAAAVTNTNHSTSALLPWNPQLNSTSNTVLADAANRVVIGGGFTYFKYETRSYLAALDNSSELVQAWNPNVNSTVYSLVLDDNKLYAGGTFSQIGGQPRRGVSRFNISPGAANTLDIAWNANFSGSPTIYGVTVTGDRVYVAGSFDEPFAGNARKHAAAFSKTSGTLLPWNPRLSNSANVIAVAGGDICIGGSFDYLKHESRSNLLAYNENTGLITPWNPNVNSNVYTFMLDSLHMYLGGAFTQAGGQPRNYLAQINLSTGNATTWNPNLNNAVYALARSGNTLYAGGAFTTAKGQSRNRAVAFTTTSDTPLDWNPDADQDVNALLVLGDKVYMGGSFTTLNGQAHARLARVDATSGLKDSWTPAPNSTVNALSANSQYLFVGGSFSQIGGQGIRYVASYDLGTSALRTNWDALVNSTVQGITANDSLVGIMGSFTQAGGLTSRYGAILSPGGGVAITGFDLASTGYVIYDADSLLYLGGNFSSAEAYARARYLAVYRKNFFVGLEPVSQADLGVTVYPNPATEYLTITHDRTQTLSYALMTLTGQTLRQGSLELETTLPVGHLPAGMYLLRVYDETHSTVIRVVVR